MKKTKKLLTSAVVAAMFFVLSGIAAFAAEDETNSVNIINRLSSDYGYTITFLAGNHGILDKTKISCTSSGAEIAISEDMGQLKISNLKAGDQITFETQEFVAVKKADTSSMYYAKGFRADGTDKIVAKQNFSITVSEDAQYVAAYGMKSQVAFTVKYQDKSGKTLSADDVFYGDAGTKPVVVCKRISGYYPTVVAFTKTLSDNAAENVFTFVYDTVPADKVDEVVNEEMEYNYVTVGGETVIIGGGTVGGTATNVTGGAAGGNAGAETTEEAGGNAEAPVIDESQIVDLDDEEVPLANMELEGNEVSSKSSVGVYVGLGALALIIVAIYAYIVSKKKNI